MAFFYARWAGHVASTPSAQKAAPFSITIAVASSTSTTLIAIFYILRTRHVTATPCAEVGAVSSCITLTRRRAATATYVAGGGHRNPGKHKWQQSDEQW